MHHIYDFDINEYLNENNTLNTSIDEYHEEET